MTQDDAWFYRKDKEKLADVEGGAKWQKKSVDGQDVCETGFFLKRVSTQLFLPSPLLLLLWFYIHLWLDW